MTSEFRRLAAYVSILVTAVVPTIAGAHHPADDEGDMRTVVIWVGAAVVWAVLMLLLWVSSRRRRREESQDADA